MNKQQKEAAAAQLAEEKKVLNALKKHYGQAAKDAAEKISFHQGKIDIILSEWDGVDDDMRSLLQSQIYQKQYQESLKKQIDAIVDNMNQKQYKTVDAYLKGCYEKGFLSSMYDLHGQGMPFIMPIDQKAMVKAATLDSKISEKLYKTYTAELKKRIQAEVSRGIATNQQYATIARNLNMQTNIGLNKAMRIARTEGHGVQIQAAVDAQYQAKKAGANILKQWNSVLDGKTRTSHRLLDGELRELDETFSNGMKYPSDPAGGAAEVVNCRCLLMQRSRKALDEDEYKRLQERARYFGLLAEDSKEFGHKKGKFVFSDFQKKYMTAADTVQKQSMVNPSNKFGDTIIFDEKLSGEKWDEPVEVIKSLSEEYNTRLSVVRGYAKGENTKHVAGEVDNYTGVMKLSSAKMDTAMHEFAHSLSNTNLKNLGDTSDDEFWKDIRKVRTAYKKHVRDNPLDKISFYADDSIDEFFAEAFAHAKLAEKGYDTSKYGSDLTYSNKVLEVVNKYFKKETVEKSAKISIIKSIDIDDLQAATYGKNIASEVEDVIYKTIKAAERKGELFVSNVEVKNIAPIASSIPVLQIEPDQYGLLKLNMNASVLADKTLAEIDAMFAGYNKTKANTLEEAVKHECGHAKLIKGLNIEQIETLYAELADIHIEGISEMAYSDGAECIAEVEILLFRGEPVPEEALKLYEKYIKR